MDSNLATLLEDWRAYFLQSRHWYSPAIEPKLKSVREALIIVGRSYFSGGMTPLEKSANNILT